jgi:hypothetical protein
LGLPADATAACSFANPARLSLPAAHSAAAIEYRPVVIDLAFYIAFRISSANAYFTTPRALVEFPNDKTA